MKKIKILLIGLLMSATLFLPQGGVLKAQLSIPSDLHPEYAPEGYSELHPETEGTKAEQKFGSDAINWVIADIIVVMLQMAGVLAIFFIIQSGFTYVRAFGQEEAIQSAKKGLTWAILGLCLVILSYAIVQAIIRITLSVEPATTTTTTEASTETPAANTLYLGFRFVGDEESNEAVIV